MSSHFIDEKLLKVELLFMCEVFYVQSLLCAISLIFFIEE